MPLREIRKRTFRPQDINTRFFKLVDGNYFHEVPFEELEKRYFECKKEIEEAEKKEEK